MNLSVTGSGWHGAVPAPQDKRQGLQSTSIAFESTGREGSRIEMVTLFCYGTLQSHMVMKAVTGQEFLGKAATLYNWARYRVKGSE